MLIEQEKDPEEERRRMNRGKVGRPFTYTYSLIWALAVLPGLPLSSPTANWLAS